MTHLFILVLYEDNGKENGNYYGTVVYIFVSFLEGGRGGGLKKKDVTYPGFSYAPVL